MGWALDKLFVEINSSKKDNLFKRTSAREG
jgi:hypothetical protein